MATNGPEKKVEDKIKNILESHGAFYFKHFATAKTKKGIPDIIAVCYGYPIFIEVKAPNGKSKVKQKEKAKLISDNDGIAIITADPLFVSDVLEMLRDNKKIKQSDLPSPFVYCNQLEEPTVYDSIQYRGVWGDVLLER